MIPPDRAPSPIRRPGLPALLWLITIVIALVALVALFGRGVGGGFIFDDFPNLLDDPTWRMQSFSWSEITRVATSGFAGFAGRPLAMLSFGVNHALTGMDAASIKWTNIGIHALNAGLVYVLLVLVFRAANLDGPRDRPGRVAALAIAFAWAIHPLQASTVLYAVQRMELGAATGILLSLVFYAKARLRQMDHRHGRWFLAAAALSILYGLGFKETAVLSPLFMGVLELTVFRARGTPVVRRLLLIMTWLSAAVAAVVFAFVVFPAFATEAAYATRNFSWQERLATQGPVLLMYLRQILVPLPDSLLFYYDDFPIARGVLSDPSAIVGWGIVIGTMIGALVIRRRAPLVALGVLWFFVAHALTSNIVPLEIAFEHRNHLALLGPVLALGIIGIRITRSLHMDARLTLAGCVLVAIAWLSWIQISTWSNAFGLATTLASRNPDSARASYALGALLLAQSGNDSSEPAWDLARKEFENAARAPDGSALPEQALVIMHARAGEPVPDALWVSLQQKYANRTITPENEGALWQLLDCRIRTECDFDDVQLMNVFGTALEKNPASPRVHSMYGTFAFNVIGDRQLGIRIMRETVALAPTSPQFKINLARFLACTGSHDDEVASLVDEVAKVDHTGLYDHDIALVAEARVTCRDGGTERSRD